MLGFGYEYPDGTTWAHKLPKHLYDLLMTYEDDEGNISSEAGKLCGNYIMFCGYKLKVYVYEVGVTGTFKVRLE